MEKAGPVESRGIRTKLYSTKALGGHCDRA
jgi:hypothetical protein